MKFLIIIPVHNEESFIFDNLQSLANQSFKNFECVIVNDGSTDESQQKIESFIQDDFSKQFQLINLEKSIHSPGAKVVQTFYKGLQTRDLKDFDVICKFDADIIFPKNYLSELNTIYERNPKAGMVSGLVFINKKGNILDDIFNFENAENYWKFENLSSKNHVRGPIKSYRKKCFEDMNGLRRVLGWDNIDVMLAKMNHWETITIKDLWVKHLKPTAFLYQKQKAEKLGIYFYNIGLNSPLAAISAAKSASKDNSISNFFVIMNSFFKQKHKRELTIEEIKYIRNLRWKEMKGKIKF
ncbi:glycosyltransferase family A protein [Frigoriflavimonas asaccharolytica]|uniref:Glycosyltransferase involved in cell wall biosynthesis n=1 Tax=Frigoriflavimonas asaccharolytica TaxID=2735899 RepID=A0A8J8G6R6_9FLAO|nr:glycosyltransferase family A protein [Frigoriflavimonas asaccharolytica]NRS92366.1 glycosyltransferase involved in cell wall biosynthesis [Frigoriflavimonas asaccharolytica]